MSAAMLTPKVFSDFPLNRHIPIARQCVATLYKRKRSLINGQQGMPKVNDKPVNEININKCVIVTLIKL
jgi:hypothetical protein